MAAVPALGSLCYLDAALMLMLTLFLQMMGTDWLWPMLPLKVRTKEAKSIDDRLSRAVARGLPNRRAG